MAVKPERDAIVNEILLELDLGTSFSECKSLTVEKWRISERTFDRYWDMATERYQETNKRVSDALLGERIKLEKERLKSAILTRHERMEILTQIAKGELTFQKEVVTKMGVIEITAKPEFKDRKDAVAELNRMDGEYAPAKKDVTSGGEPIKQITGIVVE